MKKVFISYSHQDSEMGYKLHKLLEPIGIEMFFDSASIGWGKEWELELEKGLEQSDCIIPCLSASYLESIWCRKEVRHFEKRYETKSQNSQDQSTTRVLPLKFGPWTGELTGLLSRLQFIDVSCDNLLVERSWDIYRGLDVLPPVQGCFSNRSIPGQSLREGFIGRAKKIFKIHDKLHDHDSGVSILTGIGGIGKTQLAIEYAYRFCVFYDGGIVWIDADARHGSIDLVAQFEQQIGEGRFEIDEARFKKARKYLSKIEDLGHALGIIRCGKPMLIIFDNVSEDADLRQFVQHMGSGVYGIITTRRDVSESGAVEVGPMSEAEGIELLSHCRESEVPKRNFGQDAKMLVQRLEGHPLALELVRGYLNNTNAAIQDVLETIKDVGELASCETFEEEHGESLPHHSKSISATFKMSYDKIVSTSEREILNSIGLMEPLGIPRKILAEALGVESGSATDQALVSGIDNLSKSWGIIGTDSERDPKAHRLVMAYIRFRLGKTRGLYTHFLNTLASTLDSNLTKVLRGQTDMNPWTRQKLLVHAEGMCTSDLMNEEALAAVMLCKLGRIREMIGNKKKAVEDLELAVSKAKKVEDSLLCARAQTFLGVSQFHLGKYDESKRSLDRAKAKYDTLDNDGGLSVEDLFAYGTCLDYIGENLREQDEYDKAEDMHKKALEIAESLPDEHKKDLQTIATHANAQIGAIYLRRKNYDETVRYWKQCLQNSKDINDKPWIAHYSIDVGFVHLLNREYEKASKYLEDGLEAAEDGGYLDNVSRGCMNIGSLKFAKGDYSGAKTEYERALKIAQENDVARLVWRTEFNLGNVYRALNNGPLAREFYMKGIEDLGKLRENKTDEKERADFMAHRMKPYKTMILLAIERDTNSSSSEGIIADTEDADYFVRQGMHELLAGFEKNARKGLDLKKECDEDRNLFIVDDKWYYVETE